MKNPPGYPLPSGELGSDDIVCQLVYLPDRPEYWQAFYAALHYMTTWRAWERDDDRRGKDAAANWREAFELTSGCWRMTCLEQLQDDVAAILRIMEMGQSCCDEIDVTDGDQYTDRVEDGVGAVPQNIIDAGYADDAADWDGFDDYKCMIAHVIVDQLNARLLELAPIVNSYGAVFGGMAALAAVLAVVFATGGTAIVFGLVAGLGSVALLYESLLEGDLLVTLAAKVVTNHDELACAAYFSDGDVDALSNLNDKIDELFTVPEALILTNMNLGPTLKALYAGRYDQQDIAEILFEAGYDVESFDCSCDEIGEYQYLADFEIGWDGWHNHSGTRSTGAAYEGTWGINLLYHTPYMDMSHNQLRFQLDGEVGGAGDYVTIHSLSFWHKETSDDNIYPRMTIKHSLGTEISDGTNSRDVWQKEQFYYDPPLQVDYDDLDHDALKYEAGSGAAGWMSTDYIKIDCDVFRA